MNEFVIFADSACDISPATLERWGVRYACLTLHFEDDGIEMKDSDIDPHEFYEKMRAGHVARTAAANMATFKDLFEEELKKGNDILYIGFSSGLSTTYNSGAMAAGELAEKYPDRKLITIDSLCASTGFGLLLYLAVLKKESGATLEQTADYVRERIPHICHWFTVDDLKYLKRGGRVSPTAAFVGGILGIKPVMHTDINGKLTNVSKVRGRKAAINALAEKYGELAEHPGEGPVFICNGDCGEDVEMLKRILKEKYGTCVDMVTPTGPVIGSHSGPGTLALFFEGKNR